MSSGKNNQKLLLWNEDNSEVAPRIISITEIEDGAPVTYTPQQVLSGLILRDLDGASRTDTFPTAADIIDYLETTTGKIPVGWSTNLHIRNITNDAYTLTVNNATGVDIYGENTIAQNNGKDFLIVVLETTVSVFAKGSVDFTN